MSYTDTLNRKKADISVFYKTIGNLKLPLQAFLPDNFNNTKKYKAVIAIHGGAWSSVKETPDNWDGGWMANNVKYYAQKGYVGIVFTYRDLKLDADCDVGDLLSDCRDAIKYIADNFSFVDAENTVFMGDSAGGHLTLCLGMCLPDGKSTAIVPNKIAAYNPVTDCVSDKWSYCAENAIKYSPVHNVRPINAEVLIMHGTSDNVVRIEDSRSFSKAMKDVGNRISLIEVPNANHAFILFGYTAEEKDVINALELTDRYLNL